MYIPTEDRLAIMQYLFKEGVLVAKNDLRLKTHPNIQGVKNLYVVKLLKGFATRGLVKEQYAWRHHYWFLTNAGVNFLREYLHLPPNIVPATHKQGKTNIKILGERPQRRPFQKSGDRQGYRGGDKKNVAPSEFKPQFAGEQGEQKQTTTAPTEQKPRTGGRGKGFQQQ
ncbi:hypothetical protein ABK040_013031 [Willaertia magna]